MTKQATRLYVPRGTRLHTVWRVLRADGSLSWQVWTACPDPNAPFEQMLGTHMELSSDGAVHRVTERTTDVDVFEVMPPFTDEKV